jgi:hypothetical protein
MVDLPPPEGPTRATVAPFGIVNEIPFKAV